MPKISIIIPVYNAEKYLHECLDSVVNQSLDDIEIIAIDDASKDNSYKILKEYEERYPSKIKVFKNKINLGQGQTKNKALKFAAGKYIGFVDSDDYVHYQMFETLYKEAIENNYPEVITTGIAFVKNDYKAPQEPEEGYRKDVYDPANTFSHVLEQSPSCCNKIFLRSSINDLKFTKGMWEDIAYSYSSLFNANKIVHVSFQNYFYRKQLDSGISARGFCPNIHLLDIFRVCDDLKNNTIKSGRYFRLKTQIDFVIYRSCLQRISEVLRWNIPERKKESLCYFLHLKIVEKYGDYRKFNDDILSVCMGVMELDELKNIVKKYENKPSIGISRKRINSK